MAIVRPTFTSDAGWSATTPQGIQYRAYVIWRLRGKGQQEAPLAREYVTYDLVEPPTFVRGRSVDGVSLGNIEVAQCSMTLLNGSLVNSSGNRTYNASGTRVFDGKYSRRNKSSPLNLESDTGAGKVINSWVGAGRYVAIDVRDIAHPNTVSRLWTGVLTDVIADTSDPLTPTVTLTAQGALYLFGDEDVEIDNTGQASKNSTRDMALAILKPARRDNNRRLGKVSVSSWATSLTEYKDEGGVLGVLGSLEVMEASGRVYENKEGDVVLAGKPSGIGTEVAVFWDAYPNTTNPEHTERGDGTNIPNLRISSAHEVNAEALIFDCFNYSVQEDVNRDYSADGAKTLIKTWELENPTEDDGRAVNEKFEGEYVFNPAPDGDGVSGETFSAIKWLPEDTEFRVKFATDVAGLATTTDDITVRYGDIKDYADGLTTTRYTGFYRFRSSPAVTFVEVGSNQNVIKWGLGRWTRPANLKAWLVEVKLYGVRRELVEKGDELKRCLDRTSVIDQVGKRDFPIAPHFHNIAEADTWTNIMAVRYTEERLRLSVEVIPTTAREFMALSELDLGERVKLELTGTGLSSSKLYIDAGTHCIIERIEHVPTDGFASAFIFDLLEAAYYEDTAITAGGFPPSSLSPTGDT
jgi:hypothetical protein